MKRACRVFGRMFCRVFCCLLATWLWAADAVAEGFSLNRFDPAPAGDPFFGVAAASDDGRGLSAAVGADYAHAPLMLRTMSDRRELGAVVSSQLTVRAGLSLVLGRRLTLSAELPVTVVNQGDSPSAPDGSRLASPGGAAPGDARARLRVRLAGGGRLALAVAGSLWLPTGSPSRYTGDGHFRPGVALLASGRASRLLWASGVGLERRRLADLTRNQMATALTGSAAAGLLFAGDRLLVGPEIAAATALSPGGRVGNLEALLGIHLRGRVLEIGLGAGPGLSVGMGTPDVRVVASAGYARQPALPAPAPSAVAMDGVVPRTGPAAPVPSTTTLAPSSLPPPPAPVEVQVTQTEIVLDDRIPFEVASARLSPEVVDRLARVARAMNDHVEIQRVAIEGYTDARESPASAFELARQRAEAVRAWLVAHGIDGRRLVTRPLGRAGPVASNVTDQGRALNRRVEFRIVPAQSATPTATQTVVESGR
jgi:outer membrane protein OmpA-like peptidoglycan-associated protein